MIGHNIFVKTQYAAMCALFVCSVVATFDSFSTRQQTTGKERKASMSMSKSKSVAADWSLLPNELLHQISQRLNTALDLLSFRSVCSSWRSSSSSLLNLSSLLDYPFPLTFPYFYNHTIDTPLELFLSLSKRTLFLFTPSPLLLNPHPQQPRHHPWLFKIGQNVLAQTLIWHPLSRFPIKQSPHFPKFIDLSQLSVSKIMHEFVLYLRKPSKSIHLRMDKVVFSWLRSKDEAFVLLTIDDGKLALFRSTDTAWNIIPEMRPTTTRFNDVCICKGKLFAVDNSGYTVRVGLDLNVEVVAHPVSERDHLFLRHKKYLVECEGELLLLDKCFSHYPFYWQERCLEGLKYDDCGEMRWRIGPTCSGAAKFKVYRLDEDEKRWVRLRSLGNKVLFLGDDSVFCVSASDLCVSRGDCVIFRDATFNIDLPKNEMGVFHLGENRISPLFGHPDYAKLFWPLSNCKYFTCILYFSRGLCH
ncbi:hypothetical protein RIF29_18343 [Crotalaria pallida]|uniref:F-box domain-containing protein n=1 Tax=Crotalaria pallida TaxID=3830 RepID=A0AAN9IFD7_CROPI